MLWYLPSFYGDIKLKKAAGDSCEIEAEQLTVKEREALERFQINAAKKGWIDKTTDLTKATDPVTIRGPIHKVQAALSRLLKPTRKLISAVKFSDGTIEEVTERTFDDDGEIAEPDNGKGPYRKQPVDEVGARRAKKKAQVATTVAEPTRGCPAPDFIKFASAGGIADLFRYWELRLAVESEASLLAAQRRDLGDVKAIEQALEGLANILNTSADGREVDSRFHYAIAAASGNDLFVSIQDSLHDRIKQGSEVAQKISGKDNHARLERIYQEHKNIFEAIMAGDGEAARTAMRTHIENARDRMFGAPKPS